MNPPSAFGRQNNMNFTSKNYCKTRQNNACEIDEVNKPSGFHVSEIPNTNTLLR